jgi:hypothetical protein
MNTVELLMGMDQSKIADVPTKKLKIKRLSEALNHDFIVTVRAIPAKRFTELVSGVSVKGSVDLGKAYDANVKIALAGMVDPDMKDKDLMEKWGCSTPGQLIQKVFKGGELSAIADEITELSGFAGNVVEEVKN